MRVTFCGTRGSTPAPGPEFVQYGGHTSCVALSHDGDGTVPTLLLDAGTGIRRVSDMLGNEPFRGTVLLTHLHWDHVQGLPFFTGGDREGARVGLLLPSQEDRDSTDGSSDGSSDDRGGLRGGDFGARNDSTDPEAVLSRMMSPPFFPISPSGLRGDWSFGLVPMHPFDTEGFTVTPHEIPHKGGRTLGFRVSDGHSTLAYVPDHCPTEYGAGPAGVGEYHDTALELARDVDLLIHDAHLRAEEVAAEGFFGHAAAEYAAGLGVAAGARLVALFHHKPSRTDEEIALTVSRFNDGPVPVIGATESSTLTL